VQSLVDAAVAALPECKLDGYGAVSVSTYGHFHGDEGAGTSNLQISVAHVNSDALAK
jgi:hypothetical protein